MNKKVDQVSIFDHPGHRSSLAYSEQGGSGTEFCIPIFHHMMSLYYSLIADQTRLATHLWSCACCRNYKNATLYKPENRENKSTNQQSNKQTKKHWQSSHNLNSTSQSGTLLMHTHAVERQLNVWWQNWKTQSDMLSGSKQKPLEQPITRGSAASPLPRASGNAPCRQEWASSRACRPCGRSPGRAWSPRTRGSAGSSWPAARPPWVSGRAADVTGGGRVLSGELLWEGRGCLAARWSTDLSGESPLDLAALESSICFVLGWRK